MLIIINDDENGGDNIDNDDGDDNDDEDGGGNINDENGVKKAISNIQLITMREIIQTYFYTKGIYNNSRLNISFLNTQTNNPGGSSAIKFLT